MVLLAATYWFAWRPLPQTSGEITAPISAKAAITRDALGVPHIEAATWEDAIFLEGYAMAQDRLWQMDGMRRLAGGELAEVVGKAALESDREARRLRMGRIADEQEKTLPAADRAVFAAYARGVNYFLETHRGSLPIEFSLLNYDPRPWRIRDSILAGLQMYRTLTTSWREEIIRQRMTEKGDSAKVNFLFPVRAGQEIQPGSNAWAVSGARTASGKPILANDPHLEFSIPSTWYMVHLRAPGVDVTGVSLPGVPAVIIGHNDRIAWGVTNLQFDVQDLYREQIDMNTGRYLFQGQPQQARLERESIAVKGEKTADFSAWVTNHGPVFLNDQNRAYSLRWAANDPGSFQFPFFDIDRAHNWTEFGAALVRFPGPAQNFVYADVDGNIGYHATGRLPIRPQTCVQGVPLDGATGECEWQGYIPFEELPQAFNPASGMIVTANQNPFPPGYSHPVAGNFAAPYRSNEIRTLLERRQKWQPAQMLEVQKDVYSAFFDFLAKQLVGAWDAQHGRPVELKEEIDLLRKWNGQVEKGTPEPMIVALSYNEIRKAIAERAAPTIGGESYDSYMAPAAVERLLRERPADWFTDYNSMLTKALTDAIEEGTRLQSSRVSRWDYGQYNMLDIVNPVVGELPVVGKYFGLGPVAMSGTATSIKQTSRRLGPSMRMVVDLSNLDQSLANLTAGESGQPLSPHYKDQWPAYYGGTSFPMQYRKIDAKQVLTVNPGH